MDDRTAKVSELLQEAREVHHAVYRADDGADDDWATWYADWLVNRSKLSEILGVRPVRSELTWLLVGLDKEHGEESSQDRWQDHYAKRIVEHFAEG